MKDRNGSSHFVVVFLKSSAVATAARIVFFPVFVSDLTSALTSAVLPALDEALVEVGSDDALVELGTANVLEAVESVSVGVVFDETEAARSLLEAVEAHD